ncbi:uncharacterized protein LOC116195408 [Punica granatum]|uniref:Uncharacterized protein LOC116195408 n=1 Tax=Punica granatum TaxID=22663 RepID=A0A218X201_PUNGR|nr:uncharacterized protein LOC116195408 [Punica granatum]OWM79017.1 hypothetical protein CDL15_Pgr003188 [Punica granatum]
MDHSPDGVSLMAVCAVSGSVALLAVQAYKRLLSDFMKRMEQELGGSGKSEISRRPRVRFTDDTIMPLPDEAEYCGAKQAKGDRSRTEQTMPVNRQVLYRGILQYRNFRGHHVSSDSF